MSSQETENTNTVETQSNVIKVNPDELSNAFSKNATEQPMDPERLKRIELRKQQLKDKFQEMMNKYFDKDDPRSIPNALMKHANLGNENVYINLIRSDFTGWHTFVKGGYKNAHPRKCVHMFLRYAVENDYLPRNVRWNIWNNQSFTVVFNLKRSFQRDESGDQGQEQDRDLGPLQESGPGDQEEEEEPSVSV